MKDTNSYPELYIVVGAKGEGLWKVLDGAENPDSAVRKLKDYHSSGFEARVVRYAAVESLT